MREIVFLSLLAAIVSCSTGSSAPTNTAPSTELQRDLYTLGVGDVISINVWGNPDLSLSVPVRPDGYISMPLLGDVAASGLDATTLSENISEMLRESIRNPQVTVIVNQVNSTVYLSRVRVTGAVGSPSAIPWARGMTVLDAILQANGVNDLAAPNRAKLFRQQNGEVQEFELRIDDIFQRGRLETNYELQPGDVITVPERFF